MYQQMVVLLLCASQLWLFCSYVPTSCGGSVVMYQPVRANITGRECLYTDGGLLDQYPIACFDNRHPETNIEGSDALEVLNDKTLGLYVVGALVPLDIHLINIF